MLDSGSPLRGVRNDGGWESPSVRSDGRWESVFSPLSRGCVKRRTRNPVSWAECWIPDRRCAASGMTEGWSHSHSAVIPGLRKAQNPESSL